MTDLASKKTEQEDLGRDLLAIVKKLGLAPEQEADLMTELTVYVVDWGEKVRVKAYGAGRASV